jgi:membrane protein implicated in regulation of membrane protease activity
VGYTGPNSNVSLAGTVALFVAVNVLLLAAMYPVFAAVAMLGLMSGYAVARYRGRTTRLQSDSETRPPQATPRPR